MFFDEMKRSGQFKLYKANNVVWDADLFVVVTEILFLLGRKGFSHFLTGASAASVEMKVAYFYRFESGVSCSRYSSILF